MPEWGFNTGSGSASKYDFPQDLDGFGYRVTEQGELRQKETGERFTFEVKQGDRAFNQAHYEALGDAVARRIEEMLQERGLERVVLPLEAKEDEPHTYIFATKELKTDTRRLMVLVPGSNIRVAQWARKIVMNDSVYRGSVLEFVDRALSQGYSILVLNTNLNTWKDPSEDERDVPSNESPRNHLMYVWDNVIQPSAASAIFVVAHSAGGAHTVNLVEERATETTSRISSVAFTDSVHSAYQMAKPRLPWYETRCINYVASNAPLDEDLGGVRGGTPIRSSGHNQHEYTTPSAIEPIFAMFKSKWAGDDVAAAPNGDSQNAESLYFEL